jgi:hypothetical protein
MSRGYGAYARLIVEDDKSAIYEYAAYNWNIPESYNKECECDGIISFPKSILLKPEFLTKRKETKKIITSPYDDVSEVIKNNQIFIKSSKYEWEIQNGIGSMAFRTLWSIFKEYQKEEKLPEQWSSLS